MVDDFTKKDLKKLIEDRVKHLHKGPLTEQLIADYQMIIDNIDKLRIDDGHGGEVSKKRKITPRNAFIGQCMRSPDKGGKGEDMGTCSEEWSTMTEEERSKYREIADKKNVE